MEKWNFNRKKCISILCWLFVFCVIGTQIGCENLKSAIPANGKRPYEMEWVNRDKDDHVPLVDFENVDGWTVEAENGTAQINRSQEQLIWGEYTCKVAYAADEKDGKKASFFIKPAKPVEIKDSFTDVNLWVYGNYQRWREDHYKPMEKFMLVLETAGGKQIELPFNRFHDWPEWYLLHIRLTADQQNAFAKGGKFVGIRLYHGQRDEKRAIFLDNLSFYTEKLDGKVEYQVLPRPGVDLAEGQDLGVHTASERLPFPTRKETILPDNLVDDFKTEVIKDGNAYVLRYKGSDGTLEYRYTPETGDLSDMTAQWMDGKSNVIRPMDTGGVFFKINDYVDKIVQIRFGTYRPDKVLTAPIQKSELVDVKIENDTVVAKWKVSRYAQTGEVEYKFSILQKSLVTDVKCLGGEIGKISLGKVSNAIDPKLIKVPYWVGRPYVVQMGTKDNPLFMTSLVDYYRTGSSQLFFNGKDEAKVTTPTDGSSKYGVYDENGTYCNGGVHYLPKTNGKRNDCYERFFVTLSPKFEEVLANIPNPVARWRDVAADYLVCYYTVKDRDKEYEYWKKNARYGMNKVIMMDWETCWRDDGDSFTYRTQAAPGKGGDKSLQEYIQKVQALGFRYALYNNYVDHAPVNANWDEDMIIRLPSGQWQQAWFRCYSPKPVLAVKFSREMTKISQEKFKPMAAGPDVHTAVSPFSHVDFDHRMPGAGTMLSQFYSYGQLLYQQQQIWNGPVYSERGNNYYYAGMTTGSGGMDHHFKFNKEPWLVDFYLRKMQPISAHWSIGHNKEAEDKDAAGDQYFARTIAFAQPCGFLGGWNRPFNHVVLRGYYMMQQLQASYVKAHIEKIEYAGADGRLMETTEAITKDVVKYNRLKLTFDNGLVAWVNGGKTNWDIPDAILPPYGYYAARPESKLKVASVMVDGRRTDYVHSGAYDYIDGRGKWFETPSGATDEQLIVLKKENGMLEVIPFRTAKFGLVLDKMPVKIVALDEDRNVIKTTQGQKRDKYYYIKPVPAAISYVLEF
jgi:hypothetical protein